MRCVTRTGIEKRIHCAIQQRRRVAAPARATSVDGSNDTAGLDSLPETSIGVRWLRGRATGAFDLT
jgi:hypothetical protein